MTLGNDSRPVRSVETSGPDLGYYRNQPFFFKNSWSISLRARLTPLTLTPGSAHSTHSHSGLRSLTPQLGGTLLFLLFNILKVVLLPVLINTSGRTVYARIVSRTAVEPNSTSALSKYGSNERNGAFVFQVPFTHSSKVSLDHCRWRSRKDATARANRMTMSREKSRQFERQS